MDIVARGIGFFNWVGLFHFMNLLLIGFLIRSGIQVLSAHPRLYWKDDCRQGSEWLKFSKKRMPEDRLWTASDEEESFNSWVALPGGKNLGMGRHWHFFCAIFWILTGLGYYACLFATGEWRRLIPTSWSIFPAAAHTALIYAHLHLPPEGHPYNPLQQLTYAGVVFLLAPLSIVTALTMSPAFTGHFPRYLRVFRGRQPGRSIHFLVMCAFLAFIVGHVALVVIADFPRHMAYIIHGRPGQSQMVSVAIGLTGLVVVVLLHVWATRISWRSPRRVQQALGRVVERARCLFFHHLDSRQHYPTSEISPYLIVNGYPPTSPEYAGLAEEGFRDWRLSISGLVEWPLQLSLQDLREMRAQTQITKHNCIQGWSGVAEWTGVPVADLLDRCHPLPEARFLLLRGYDEHEPGKPYYETIDLELARHDQTILAYAMNGEPLTVPHGAPCRLRVETQLGFKMVKFLRSVEVIAEYGAIGDGQGGYREDAQYYDQTAGI